MLTLRLLLLSTLIIFFPLSSSHQLSDEVAHAQNWAMQSYKNMTPQELQLTTNIMYLLYANALIDTTIQQFFTPISRLTQSILYHMNDPKSPNKDLITLKTLIERLSIITRTRFIYTEMLNNALSYQNNNESTATNNALDDLQLYGQTFVRSCADQNSEETIAHLQHCQQVLAESAQTFHAASGLHKGLSENVLPIEIEEENKSLATLSLILNNAQLLISSTNTLVNAINDSCDHTMEIICLGATIYKHHYEALYMIVTSPSFDQQYARTLFDMHGLLSPEYQSDLPRPDQMLPHILKTAKLYTQTELVPL